VPGRAGGRPQPAGNPGAQHLITGIRDDHGIGILLIEHDMSVVMQISDHVVVLDYGRKISDGTPEEVRADPAVIRAYLGEEEDDDRPPAWRPKAGIEPQQRP
jgi:branched-chain amino acid transport system ATP-binding protein